MMHRQLTLLLALTLPVFVTACNEDAVSSGPDFVTELRLEQPDGSESRNFQQGEDAQVVLTVRNRSSHEQTLEFSDGRNSDFAVFDDQGNAVRIWSSEHAFTQAMTEVTIPAGDSRAFTMDWPGLRDDDGDPLPVGDYEVQGWLPAGDEDGIDDLEPGPLRSTLVPFQISPQDG